MNGAGIDGQGRFLDRFAIARMGMAGARNVFRRGAKFHGQAGFGNQFAGDGPDDVYAKDAVCFFVRKDFYKAFGVATCMCPTVCLKGEFADFVLGARGF